MAGTGLNVLANDFNDIFDVDTMHADAIFRGMPLPQGCRGCPERETCAGGYLPHRYSRARGFDNPSVWCEDLLKLFSHVRHRLGVSIADTRARRDKLSQTAGQGPTSRGRRRTRTRAPRPDSVTVPV
jgi:uncharacterized protein